MGLFGGLKWDRKRLMPGDPSEMEMGANGLIQGGDTSMERLPGFFDGGDKLTGRDIIGGILAAIGDGLAQHSGGRGGAVQGLTDNRFSALAMAKKAQEQQAQMLAARQRAIAAGVDPARAEMMASGDPNPAEWMPKQDDDVLTRRMRAAGIDPDSDEGRNIYRQNVQNMGDPDVAMNLGGNRFYAGPRSGLKDALGSGGPQPGTVESGFRFKGGNPADRSNWEPVGGGASNGTGGFPPRLRR